MNEDSRKPERIRMVDYQIAARGVRDERVLTVMRELPRHLFVPEPYRAAAYQDSPLPIGQGQTISQPYIVARMTELLEISPEDRVLEIGTGSGYQAAILGRLAREVVTIERIPEVADQAKKNLEHLGILNVQVEVTDGTEGYPLGAPYNAILVTASTPEVPRPLMDQLADGGRLVAPVGSRDLQDLVRLIRKGEQFTRESHGGVVFVPLLGKYGWKL
ncbi:protein-L-isoaspartate(D-aspartate) O-methyltransferase [Methanolinea mesophila]|uniref:protein-L-isoaspartate(D-aspartate) O-methyltransferase n=1 Tax=Methanolinea mesophila TaxID=547055 RepID=UPI001AE4B609|nr:protein-L-isoaspartate(D-aspartate) O-methyltransferase [Methanolinea mesophila]MBP1928644.1 protein-L-isoaspartate(D-aspartate) O-methyltransferase [Methanolinea mesophila]